MENPIEAVEEEIEELFPPKPGGIVERHRQRRAREQAQAQQAEQESEPVGEAGYKAVKVAQITPENYAATTLNIAAGSTALVLSRIPQRYRATILVATTGASVLLARDSGAALGGNGFTLPAGIPLPVQGRGQLWAYNATGGIVQVSVLSEFYDDAEMI